MASFGNAAFPMPRLAAPDLTCDFDLMREELSSLLALAAKVKANPPVLYFILSGQLLVAIVAGIVMLITGFFFATVSGNLWVW